MPFSLGVIELFFMAIRAIPVALLYARRHRFYRAGFAVFVCAGLAALLTPADIVSTILFLVAFGGVFVFGSQYRLGPPSTIA